MTTAIHLSQQIQNGKIEQENQKAKEVRSQGGRLISLIREQAKVGGLLGDVTNCFKLANFWTETLTGSITDVSNRITQAGNLMKNYFGVWELPGNIAKIGETYKGLEAKTAASVGEFASAVFSTGKSFFDGVELAGTRFGLLSQRVVAFVSPLNPAGTLAFAANQAIFKNLPDLKENVRESSAKAASAMIKLTKHVALSAVGALALVASFFKPICAPWVIPTLLTVSVASSISSRFFDGLVLESKLNAII